MHSPYFHCDGARFADRYRDERIIVDAYLAHFAPLQAERDALADQVAELKRDAERYRWLRDHRGWPFAESPGGTALDAAIDAALTEASP